MQLMQPAIESCTEFKTPRMEFFDIRLIWAEGYFLEVEHAKLSALIESPLPLYFANCG